MRAATRRIGTGLAALTLLAPTLACGGGSEEGPVTEQNFSARSARWADGCGVPLDEVTDATFHPGEEVCLELMLEGYYTEGTLEAHWLHAEQELAVGRIEFNAAQAVLQRLTEGEAASRVTFPLHGEVPPSDAYRVDVYRNERLVATYPFRVAP